jgi:cytochrome P450
VVARRSGHRPLSLKIICDMMGVPDGQYETVLANSNIILSGFDPEFLSEDMNEAVGQLLTSAQALAELVTDLAATRAEAPGEDLVSALVTANIDGEKPPAPSSPRSSSCWWWRVTRPPAPRCRTR